MVFVTPTADPSLISELTGAGYAPGEREQSLLASADLFGCAQRDERIGVARDLASWARASATAFLERDELEPNDDRIALILATTEGTTALEVRKGDVIIATAALAVRGEHATLFAGSTHPAFRRQGWHTDLIRDRVARAMPARDWCTRRLGQGVPRNGTSCAAVSFAFTRACSGEKHLPVSSPRRRQPPRRFLPRSSRRKLARSQFFALIPTARCNAFWQ